MRALVYERELEWRKIVGDLLSDVGIRDIEYVTTAEQSRDLLTQSPDIIFLEDGWVYGQRKTGIAPEGVVLFKELMSGTFGGSKPLFVVLMADPEHIRTWCYERGINTSSPEGSSGKGEEEVAAEFEVDGVKVFVCDKPNFAVGRERIRKIFGKLEQE